MASLYDYDYVFPHDSPNKNENTNINDNERTVARYGYFHHVKLSGAEYSKLLEEFGQEELEMRIQTVDCYCEETGKSYSEYVTKIQRWNVVEYARQFVKDQKAQKKAEEGIQRIREQARKSANEVKVQPPKELKNAIEELING